MSNSLQALLDAYDAERRALLVKIADLNEEGQKVYTPQTALEQMMIMQLATQGYVTLVTLEVHPEYPDLMMKFGATLTAKGREYATEMRG